MKSLLAVLGVTTAMGLVAIGCSDDGAGTDPGQMYSDKHSRSIYTDCIEFDDLQTCEVGNASIALTPDGSGLRVTNLGGPGQNGVAVSLPDVGGMRVSQNISLHEGGGNFYTLEAFAGGALASRLRMVQPPAGGAFGVTVLFTNMPGGSTYTVNVYNGTQLVGTRANVTSQQPTWVPIPPPDDDFPDDDEPGCEWDLVYASAVAVTLPGGTGVLGDRVQFVEEVAPGGSYTYRTFETLRILSNVSSFVITDYTTSAASSGCVEFDGLENCEIGEASLTLSPNGGSLIVSNLSGGGVNGVEVSLPDAAGMRVQQNIAHQGGGNYYTLEAFAGGALASRLSMVQPASGGAFGIAAEFTNMPGGSTYTLSVYNDGNLVGSMTGVTSSQLTYVDDPPPDDDFPDDDEPGCEWTVRYAAPVSITMPNGLQVQGDRIRFVEEVDPGGSYTYRTFETLRILSNVSSIVITDYTVAPTQ